MGPTRRRTVTDSTPFTLRDHLGGRALPAPRPNRVGRRHDRVRPLAGGLLGVGLALTGCGGSSSPARLADAGPAAARPASATATGAAASATGSSGSVPAAVTGAPASTEPSPPEPVAEASATASEQVRTETVTKTIKFRTLTHQDPDLDRGDTRVVRDGVKGLLELTFRVTYTNGGETGRELASKRTVRRPVDRLVAVGTRVPEPAGGDCDPNYSGACVPIDSDVDCAGGSGNGPSYVDGPVRVVGTDVYHLDRDGDGIGCD